MWKGDLRAKYLTRAGEEQVMAMNEDEKEIELCKAVQRMQELCVSDAFLIRGSA